MPVPPQTTPLIDTPRIVTTSVGAALIVMPLTEVTVIVAAAPSPLMVTPLVIVTGAYSPESSTTISPPADVFAKAARKDLQGDVEEQGFTLLPAFETYVLKTVCALAGEVNV